MKNLSISFLLFLSIAVQASPNSGRLTLTAQSATQRISLTDQKFEPVYESQPYETTCSREVLDHVENVCQTISDNVCSGGAEVCETANDSVCNSGGCTNVPRRVCHTTPATCVDVPRRVCSDHNVFRTDYYSCTQYHDVVVGQRLVKTFNHQIEVTVANPALLSGAVLTLSVAASEASLSARLANSFPGGLLNYQVATINESDSGMMLNRQEKIVIDLALSAVLLQQMNTVSMDNLALGTSAVRFQLRNASELAGHLSIGIRIIRNRSLFGNATRYDGTLDSATLGLVGQGSDIQALIPFQKLSIDPISNLRHDLTVSAKLNPGTAPLLNAADFQAQLSKNVEQSITKVKPSF